MPKPIDKYKLLPALILWENALPYGVSYSPTKAAFMFGYEMELESGTPGLTAQTIAAMLVKHCGWTRDKYMVHKPLPPGASL
jgi:hypothetical protein